MRLSAHRHHVGIILSVVCLFASLASAQTATVNLTWVGGITPPSQISKYQIYRANVVGGPYALVGNSGNATTLTFSQGFTLLSSVQDYYYAVRTLALDGKTESDNSNVVHATIPALPVVKPAPPVQSCTITITGATVTGTCQ